LVLVQPSTPSGFTTLNVFELAEGKPLDDTVNTQPEILPAAVLASVENVAVPFATVDAEPVIEHDDELADTDVPAAGGDPLTSNCTFTGRPVGLLNGVFVMGYPVNALAGWFTNVSVQFVLIAVGAGNGDRSNVWLGLEGEPAQACANHVAFAVPQVPVVVTLSVSVIDFLTGPLMFVN
jgi:hypothetical protein